MATPPKAQSSDTLAQRFAEISERVRAAGGTRSIELLAVSKTRSADEVAALAACGQVAFGENYVQEAQPKIESLAPLKLRWHLIGHLQSNKSALAASLFDCIESIDRAKLLPLLDAARAQTGREPLDVLLQVNIDDEASKFGCQPQQLPELAGLTARYTHLRLRGIMSIPAPAEERTARCASFAALRELFESLRAEHPKIDTLSMGMSEDFELAIEQGSTRVRVGSALFGPRPARAGDLLTRAR